MIKNNIAQVSKVVLGISTLYMFEIYINNKEFHRCFQKA